MINPWLHNHPAAHRAALAVLLLLGLLLAQCRSLEYMDARQNVSQSFEQSDYERAVELLEGYREDGVYREQDRVLYNLEKSLAARYAGDYRLSNEHFDRAEALIDSLYGVSVTRNLRAFIINDYELEYAGEDYENVYLNAFKALNYLHMGDYEAALVESRRIGFKLRDYVDRHRRVANEAAAEDTTGLGDTVSWQPGPAQVEHSPMGHYLSTVIFTQQGRLDNARIEHESLLQALENHGRHEALRDEAFREDMDRLTRPGDYNTLAMAFSGRSPIKREERVDLYLPEKEVYLTAAYPVLESRESEVDRVQVRVSEGGPASGQTKELRKIEDMEQVATQIYETRRPLVYSRAVVRAFLRAAGARGAAHLAEEGTRRLLADDEEEGEEEEGADGGEDEARGSREDNGAGAGETAELVGTLVGAALNLGQRGVEVADLRSWTTLPGVAHGQVLDLPEGRHELEFRYLDRAGRTVHRETRQVAIEDGGDDLTLVEGIYWN